MKKYLIIKNKNNYNDDMSTRDEQNETMEFVEEKPILNSMKGYIG
jgi:hypothetical protein